MVAGYDTGGASLEGRCDVLVVVGIFADAAELSRADNEIRQDDDVLKPQLPIDVAKQLANFRIREGSQYLIQDGRREHDLEVRIAQKPLDQSARGAAWLDDGAEVDIRVEHGTQQWLLGLAALAGPFSSRALSLEGDREGSFLAHRTLLLRLEELQRMPPCKAPHLFQALDRHQCGQWLALPLDDKLVVTQGHPVEQVTDPLANVYCGYLFHL